MALALAACIYRRFRCLYLTSILQHRNKLFGGLIVTASEKEQIGLFQNPSCISGFSRQLARRMAFSLHLINAWSILSLLCSRAGREPLCHVAERSWCCQALLAEARVRSLPILRLASALPTATSLRHACTLSGPQQTSRWEVQ